MAPIIQSAVERIVMEDLDRLHLCTEEEESKFSEKIFEEDANNMFEPVSYKEIEGETLVN